MIQIDKILLVDEIDEYITEEKTQQMKAPKISKAQSEALNTFSTTDYKLPGEIKWDTVQQLLSMGLLAEKVISNGPNLYRRRTQKELIEMLQKY